jgi:hypothetical protein
MPVLRRLGPPGGTLSSAARRRGAAAAALRGPRELCAMLEVWRVRPPERRVQVHTSHVEATQRAPAFGLARPAGGREGEPNFAGPRHYSLRTAPTCIPLFATTANKTNTTPSSPPPRLKAASPFDAWVEALYSTIEAPEHAKTQQNVPLSGNDQVEDERNWNRHRECRRAIPEVPATAHICPSLTHSPNQPRNRQVQLAHRDEVVQTPRLLPLAAPLSVTAHTYRRRSALPPVF